MEDVQDRVADNFDLLPDAVDTTLTLAPPGSNTNRAQHPPASDRYEELTGITNAYLSSGNQVDNGHPVAPTLPPGVGLNQPWYGHGPNVGVISSSFYYDEAHNNNLPFHNTGGVRMGVNSLPNGTRVCARCGTTTTPMWRRGPGGPQTHCNACGLRYARLFRRTARSR